MYSFDSESDAIIYDEQNRFFPRNNCVRERKRCLWQPVFFNKKIIPCFASQEKSLRNFVQVQFQVKRNN